MFKPQYDEYIKVPKNLLQWIFNNLYMLNNCQIYSSSELDKIISFLKTLGFDLVKLD